MNRKTLCRALILSASALSAAAAQSPIIISDGPSSSAPTSTQKIVISDGPTGSSAHTVIVTTDGPAQMPYQTPPPIIITDGPSQLPYSTASKGITVSDGPGTTRTMEAKHRATADVAAAPPSRGADPETSALAPVMTAAQFDVPPTAARAAGAATSNSWYGTHATSSREPFYIYSDMQNSGNHFLPTGWMGDYRDIRLDVSSRNHPHSGKSCIKVIYTAAGTQGNGWAGIYWQTPANNWGDKPGGYDLTGKRRLTFWARGDKGGEIIAEFKIGGITGESGDSSEAGTGSIVLTPEWRKYTIGLADKDLTHIIGGFCWTAARDANPNGITFYLDDIRYE